MASSDILLESFETYEDCEIFGDDSSKIKNLSVKLNGNVTDLVLCDYSEKQFLIITQFRKIGTLISVTKCSSKNLSGVNDLYDVKTFFGSDNEEYHLVARYLAQQLQIVKPLIIGVSLKDNSLDTLKAIVKVLKENLFF